MAAPHSTSKVGGGWLIPFLDLLLILVLILLALVHPPKTNDDEKRLGAVALQIRWPDHPKCDDDVDAWALAPGDRPVGYSNQRGQIFSLLRDDLGMQTDLSGVNMEHIFSRGSPDGEYAFTIHLFRPGSCAPNIPVDWIVTIKPQYGVRSIIAEGRNTLTVVDEEQTLIRFTLKEGRMVPGSRHDLPIKLRRSY